MALAFYDGACRFAEKSEYRKLTNLLEKEMSDIIAPQVDELPEIIENKLLGKLQTLGYESVFIYSDIYDKDQLYAINDLIAKPNGLISHVRIETPDSKVLVAQDFDRRFSYMLAEKSLLTNFVESINLEGFFCDDETPESWSYYEIAKRDKIDWNEDMIERNEENNTTHNSNLPKAWRTWLNKLFGS